MSTKRRTSVGNELFRWFLFSVCMGLIPLLLRWLLPTLFTSLPPFGEVLKDGELLLVGIGLAGAALSDLLAARRGDAVGQGAMFLGFLCIFFGSAAYGFMNADTSSTSNIIVWSAVTFGACVVVGAAGIILKEAAE